MARSSAGRKRGGRPSSVRAEELKNGAPQRLAAWWPLSKACWSNRLRKQPSPRAQRLGPPLLTECPTLTSFRQAVLAKVQNVERPTNRSYYLNLPVVLAEALDRRKGGQWERWIEDKNTLLFSRTKKREKRRVSGKA